MFSLLACVFPARDGKPAHSLVNNPMPPLHSQLKLVRVFGDHEEMSYSDNDFEDSSSHADAGSDGSWAHLELVTDEEPASALELPVIAKAPRGLTCTSCCCTLKEGIHIVQWRTADRTVLTLCVHCTPWYAEEHGFVKPLFAEVVDFEWQCPVSFQKTAAKLVENLYVLTRDRSDDETVVEDQEEDSPLDMLEDSQKSAASQP